MISRLFKINLGLFFLIALMGCSSQQEESQSDSSAQMGKVGNANSPGVRVVYSAPDEWINVKPATSMRKDQFQLPGVEGAGDANLAVFYFPGTGGSVQANLNRWYGQFKQPDGSSTTQHVETNKTNVNGLPVTMVYVTGTYLKPKSPMMMRGPKEEKPNYALLAAIVETANGPWFFKTTGPQKTIDHWRPSFNEFVNTFRVVGS